MTRPTNPANYECKGKMVESRGYTVHHWVFDENGIARCINKGCGLTLSKENSDDLRFTPHD
jgi:hypothetical protein